MLRRHSAAAMRRIARGAEQGARAVSQEAQRLAREAQPLGAQLEARLNRQLSFAKDQGNRRVQQIRAALERRKMQRQLEAGPRESRTLECVDVQFVDKVYEDAPCDLRSRMWAAFLLDKEAWPRAAPGEEVGSPGGSSRPGSVGTQPQLGSPTSAREHAQAVWTELTALEWPLQVDPAIRKRYETLTQISLGQEEVDEHILRDIGRTFPEYAQFQDLEGQRALFDVLKAYSMSDLEVEYCQGMAFVAGTALMFLPEELAFELFHFVMAESGCNLRMLYLPGLSGMQEMLVELEEHLARFCPRLSSHMAEYCVSPVLYASSWFLTAFSNTFPVTFCTRILDVMLLERDFDILMRVAVTVLLFAEEEILTLTDLEDIVNFIKLQPALWDAERHRKAITAAFRLCLPRMEEYSRASPRKAGGSPSGEAAGEAFSPSPSPLGAPGRRGGAAGTESGAEEESEPGQEAPQERNEGERGAQPSEPLPPHGGPVRGPVPGSGRGAESPPGAASGPETGPVPQPGVEPGLEGSEASSPAKEGSEEGRAREAPLEGPVPDMERLTVADAGSALRAGRASPSRENVPTPVPEPNSAKGKPAETESDI